MNEPPGSRDGSPSPAWSQMRRGLLTEGAKGLLGWSARASQCSSPPLVLNVFSSLGSVSQTHLPAAFSAQPRFQSFSPPFPSLPSLLLSPGLQLNLSNQTPICHWTYTTIMYCDIKLGLLTFTGCGGAGGGERSSDVARPAPAPRKSQKQTTPWAWTERDGL